MTEHITREQLESLRKGVLTGAALLAADDHLSACSECRAMAGFGAALGPLVGVFDGLDRTLGVAAHPGREELADYLDLRQAPAARARIDSHLLICEDCRADVSDLSSFRKEIQIPPVRRGWLAPVLSIAAAIAIAVVLFKTGKGPARKPVVAVVKPWIVALNDGGGKVGLDPEGKFVAAGEISAADRELLGSSLRSGTLALGTLRGPGSAVGVLRGKGAKAASFRVLAPVGVVVYATRPELRWEAFPGATGYRVTVFNDGFDEMASSPELQETRWSLTKELPRGRTYSWQVLAVGGGRSVRSPQPPEPEARFKVLDVAAAAGLEPLLAASHPSHLLIAARMASLGLKDEALAQLDLLKTENPDAEIVGKLRASVMGRLP